MRYPAAVVVALALVACSAVEQASLATDDPATTVTTMAGSITTVSTPMTTPRDTRLTGGRLIKLNPETLDAVDGLDPIAIHFNTSTLASDDGDWVVVFDWGDLIPIDVGRWEATGVFDLPRHSGRVIDDDLLHMYDGETGRVFSMDLHTGNTTTLGEWPPSTSLRDGLHVMSDGRLAALASEPTGGLSVFTLDTGTGETTRIPLGEIERTNWETGVFSGGYEIPDWDSPAIVWSESHLFVVHADGPEITAVDLSAGEIDVHDLAVTSWWDRVLANWLPTASAKGPSIGTSTSAAVSPDGRYLFVSGERHDVTTAADGSLVEENEHLGLTVVDTGTWRVQDSPAIPSRSVSNAGDLVVARVTRSTSPWTEHLYLLADDSGVVSATETATIEEWCQPSDSPRIVCSVEVESRIRQLRLIDLVTSETIEGPKIGHEDHLLASGVLVDSSPFDD